MIIKNFNHNAVLREIEFDVLKDEETNHIKMKKNMFGVEYTSIDEFTKDWDKSEYYRLDLFISGCVSILDETEWW